MLYTSKQTGNISYTRRSKIIKKEASYMGSRSDRIKYVDCVNTLYFTGIHSNKTHKQAHLQINSLINLQALYALKSQIQPSIYHILPLHGFSVNQLLQVQYRSNYIKQPTPHELLL